MNIMCVTSNKVIFYVFCVNLVSDKYLILQR
jgi:hypothetical protein